MPKIVISSIFAGVACGILLALTFLVVVSSMTLSSMVLCLLGVVSIFVPMCLKGFERKGLYGWMRFVCIALSLLICVMYAYETSGNESTRSFLVSRFVVLHGVSFLVNGIWLMIKKDDA